MEDSIKLSFYLGDPVNDSNKDGTIYSAQLRNELLRSAAMLLKKTRNIDVEKDKPYSILDSVELKKDRYGWYRAYFLDGKPLFIPNNMSIVKVYFVTNEQEIVNNTIKKNIIELRYIPLDLFWGTYIGENKYKTVDNDVYSIWVGDYEDNKDVKMITALDKGQLTIVYEDTNQPINIKEEYKNIVISIAAYEGLLLKADAEGINRGKALYEKAIQTLGMMQGG